MEHVEPLRRQQADFLEGQTRDGAGLGDHAGVDLEHPGHVGPVFVDLRIEGVGHLAAGQVRAAAREHRHLALFGHAVIAGDDVDRTGFVRFLGQAGDVVVALRQHLGVEEGIADHQPHGLGQTDLGRHAAFGQVGGNDARVIVLAARGQEGNPLVAVEIGLQVALQLLKAVPGVHSQIADDAAELGQHGGLAVGGGDRLALVAEVFAVGGDVVQVVGDLFLALEAASRRRDDDEFALVVAGDDLSHFFDLGGVGNRRSAELANPVSCHNPSNLW